MWHIPDCLYCIGMKINSLFTSYLSNFCYWLNSTDFIICKHNRN